jgi:hypothetical protein
MQELHSIIHGICEQVESDIVTIYHIDESAKAQATSGTKELYADFPIRVDIKQREEVKAEQPVPAIDFAATLKQKVSVKRLKPLLKAAGAAAAVILMAVVLFQSMPAKAVTLEGIYKAIEKVKNVHITKFVPDKTETIQEKWVSRTLNIYMSKTGKQLVLWDIPKGVRKSKQADTTITETVPLTAASIADADEKIIGSLGLMPFYDISDVPEGADWSRVADKDLEAAAKGIEVYDLTWTEKAYDGSTVFKKWRVFVNFQTNLPQKTEFSEKLPTDNKYFLKSINIVEYLSSRELQAILKEASF